MFFSTPFKSLTPALDKISTCLNWLFILDIANFMFEYGTISKLVTNLTVPKNV